MSIIVLLVKIIKLLNQLIIKKVVFNLKKRGFFSACIIIDINRMLILFILIKFIPNSYVKELLLEIKKLFYCRMFYFKIL